MERVSFHVDGLPTYWRNTSVAQMFSHKAFFLSVCFNKAVIVPVIMDLDEKYTSNRKEQRNSIIKNPGVDINETSKFEI